MYKSISIILISLFCFIGYSFSKRKVDIEPYLDQSYMECTKISINQQYFSYPFEALKDSLFLAFNCDEIGFVYVYKASDNFYFAPHPLRDFELVLGVSNRLDDSLGSTSKTRFVYFNMNKVPFLMQETQFLELGFEYLIQEEDYIINLKKLKVEKTMRSEKNCHQLYVKKSPYLMFEFRDMKFISVDFN